MKVLGVSLSLLVLGCAAATATAATVVQEEEALSPEQAPEHVGKTVSVEGRVFVTRRSRAGVHLYFSPDPAAGFQALIPSSALHKFQVDPLVRFEKRSVRVTGKIEEDAGRFFIQVTDPDQIDVVRRRR